MSMFLPTGFGQTQQPQDGVASITPANPETTQEDIALMQRVLSAAMRNPNLIPSDFMSYIVDYIQTSRLIIPIGQVFGFSQFVANISTAASGSATTSTTYDDLADGVHPQISGAPDGKYVILFGASSTGTGVHMMGIQVNSTAPTSDMEIPTSSTAGAGHWAGVVTLSEGSNSLTAKYKGSDGTSVTWRSRYLLAIRYA